MSEPKRINAYEVMFLISQGEAADFAGVIEHINHLLERAEAEILGMQKWDERRLAYEIDKQKRALYILAYFNAPTVSLGQIERACNLNEQIMRVLITKSDHLSEDEMKAADAMKDLEAEAKLRATQPASIPVNVTEPPVIPADTDDEV